MGIILFIIGNPLYLYLFVCFHFMDSLSTIKIAGTTGSRNSLQFLLIQIEIVVDSMAVTKWTETQLQVWTILKDTNTGCNIMTALMIRNYQFNIAQTIVVGLSSHKTKLLPMLAPQIVLLSMCLQNHLRQHPLIFRHHSMRLGFHQ